MNTQNTTSTTVLAMRAAFNMALTALDSESRLAGVFFPANAKPFSAKAHTDTTMEQADAILDQTQWADQVEDGWEHQNGWAYVLSDSTVVVVQWDGSVAVYEPAAK